MKQATTLQQLNHLLLSDTLTPSIGFVPTMGALHAGHMALVERARAENEQVVVSIFVNPLQFGAGEDLSSYPRQLQQDAAMLEQAGVDVLYMPTPDVMYPDGFDALVHVGGLGEHYCGAARPGHFDGVTTVVLKLFNQVQPTRAYFGEKDFQQLSIINKMVQDLNVKVEVKGVPTMREPDGLALSSRNQYLSAAERQIAPKLHETLQKASVAIKAGEDVAQAIDWAKNSVLSAGFAQMDYFALVDAFTLAPLSSYQPQSRLLAAARLGATRLIDNIELV